MTEAIKKLSKALDKNMGDYVTGEDLTILEELNQLMAKNAVNFVEMLDGDKDGKLSYKDFKNDIEKLEAAIGV